MSALGIVPDGVIGPRTNPVRDWPVLPHLLCQLLLDPKRLVGRHFPFCFRSFAKVALLSYETAEVEETLEEIGRAHV